MELRIHPVTDASSADGNRSGKVSVLLSRPGGEER
jgi:hypothetical protein